MKIFLNLILLMLFNMGLFAHTGRFYQAVSVKESQTFYGPTIFACSDSVVFGIMQKYYGADLIISPNKKEGILHIREYFDYENEEITGVDFSSFQVCNYADRWWKNIIETPYAKDKNHLYYKGRIADRIDRMSFRIIDDRYAADKNHIYFDNEPIFMADIKTFQVINWAHALDKNRYYYMGKETTKREHIRFIKEQLSSGSK